MPEYTWPPTDQRSLIGKRISRVDGALKSTGRAKYTFDYNPQGLLYGKVYRSPYAHARVVSVDTSAAESMPGVKAVHVVQGPGSQINWAGDDIVAVAAVDERTARDAVRAIRVEFEPLPHFVNDSKQPPQGEIQAQGPLTKDDLEDAFDNQMPAGQLAQQIQQYGLAFKPTEEDLKMLAEMKAPQPVVDAIKNAQVHEESGNRPKSPYKQAAAQVEGDPDTAFKDPDAVISEGFYGANVAVHCCLESHGGASEWPDADHLVVHFSTQGVSGMRDEFARALKIPAANVRVLQQNIGGGFGSKFQADRWGVATAQLSKKANGKPVKIMLERAPELEVAGCRPSAFARVRVAAKKDGTITAWQSEGWGTGGPGGGSSPPLPYIFRIPNQRKVYTGVATNIGPSRAWRAPNHPQAAVITMGALEDLAAKLNMNPVEFFQKNVGITGPRAKVYAEELQIADKLMGFTQRWHARPDKTSGSMKQGLGLAIHTWGGRGHPSNCDMSIHPDGSVEIKMSTQDLGTGTRTCIMIVAADTLGVPMENIKLLIGDSDYPTSGGSGGSTTIGGVSSSTRRGAVDARDALFAKVAPALNTTPDKLQARDGKIFVSGNPSQSLTWKQACSKLGAMPITVQGKNPGPGNLTDSGVGGVQMADVSVDTDTGIVRVNKLVAVQDCGLIIDLKTAETQMHGGMIMGISTALYEEKVMDPTTGRMLNPNMEFYRLAGYGDIPELVVHMMTGPGYDERGVIGLAEPAVCSPAAAISNAVANAIGVRVPEIPLTPDRVLAALESATEGGARA